MALSIGPFASNKISGTFPCQIPRKFDRKSKTKNTKIAVFEALSKIQQFMNSQKFSYDQKGFGRPQIFGYPKGY